MLFNDRTRSDVPGRVGHGRGSVCRTGTAPHSLQDVPPPTTPRIGVQAMMLKDAVAELGAFETLRRVVDIGYRVAEISQIPLTPATVDELVKAREELGFTFSSTSAALTAVRPRRPCRRTPRSSRSAHRR